MLGHFGDEVPISKGFVAVQYPSSAQHDDSNRDFTSLKFRTSNPVPISASTRDDLQRVLAVSKGHLGSFASSPKPSDQQEARLPGIRSLFEPVDDTRVSNKSSAVGSVGLLGMDEKPVGPPGGVEMISSRGDYGHEISMEPNGQHTLAQNCERSRSVNPEPLQLASQKDSPSIEYSSYSQFSQTQSVFAPSAVYIGQPQYLSSHMPSVSSTTVQNLPSANSLELPKSIPASQSQYQMISHETPQGSILMPVDVSTASKAADEKRRRNAGASQRFRQRRKEKELEFFNKIDKLEARIREMQNERDHSHDLVSKLEAQVREMQNERDHSHDLVSKLEAQVREMQNERDHSHDLVSRHDQAFIPQSPPPERQRHAAWHESWLVQNQNLKDNGQNGMQTRKLPIIRSMAFQREMRNPVHMYY